MRRTLSLLTFGILATVATGNANAGIITGSLEAGAVDYYDFTVRRGGRASFNVFAWLPDNRLDTQLYLFRDNGSAHGALTGRRVARNDDSGRRGWDNDGSISGLDAYLRRIMLRAGDYVLAIGAAELTQREARRGSNLGSGSAASGNYQITFSNRAVLTSVPAPAPLTLLGIGLVVLALRKRRS